jgi:hypothetical protein
MSQGDRCVVVVLQCVCCPGLQCTNPLPIMCDCGGYAEIHPTSVMNDLDGTRLPVATRTSRLWSCIHPLVILWMRVPVWDGALPCSVSNRQTLVVGYMHTQSWGLLVAGTGAYFLELQPQSYMCRSWVRELMFRGVRVGNVHGKWLSRGRHASLLSAALGSASNEGTLACLCIIGIIVCTRGRHMHKHRCKKYAHTRMPSVQSCGHVCGVALKLREASPMHQRALLCPPPPLP